MARQIKITQKTEDDVVRVRCADCRNFVRDTSGISFNVQTGEFFMGICVKNTQIGVTTKMFAENLRVCNRFTKKLIDLQKNYKQINK